MQEDRKNFWPKARGQEESQAKSKRTVRLVQEHRMTNRPKARRREE